MNCPICDRDNDRDARRCRSCGVDFEDPEIAAQLDRPRPDEDADGEIDLSGGRYLGQRWVGFEAGGDLRRLALLGGVFFLIVALLPVKLAFGGVQASWSALDGGPTLALALPFVLAAIGLALGTPLGRGLPPVAVAGLLAAGGLAALALCFAPLGRHAGTPLHTQWLPWLGTFLAAAGVAIRVLRRKDPHARWIIVGGAVLVLLGLILPHNDARDHLPAEFTFYLRGHQLADSGLLTSWTEGFDNDSMVRFLSIWHLLELALLGLAIGFTLQPSTGPWDSAAHVLRPVGFALVFHLTLTFVFYTLNVMGWSTFDWVRWHDQYIDMDDFSGGMFAGRARLALLTLPVAAWVTAGLIGLYVHLVPRLGTDAAATGSPSRSA